MHCSWFGPPYERKTSASECRHVCQPAVNILNKNEISDMTDIDILLIFVLLSYDAICFYRKVCDCRNKVNWIIKHDGSRHKIQINGPKLVDATQRLRKVQLYSLTKNRNIAKSCRGYYFDWQIYSSFGQYMMYGCIQRDYREGVYVTEKHPLSKTII